jgi:signal transduction histidine kinase/ligand-binding sensor domain-containing protein
MSRISSSITVWSILFFCAVGLCAEPNIVNTKPNKFLVTKWTTEQRLPQNTVTSIVQSRDGYIWVGTFGGLARFDGVRFKLFDTANTPEMRISRILSLHEDRFQKLWIGTETGDIYYLEKGQFNVFSYGDSIRGAVWGIESDGTNSIYFSSDSGLERFSMSEEGHSKPDSGVLMSAGEGFGLYKHPDGSVWTRIQGKIYRIEGDRLVHQSDSYPELGINVSKIDFTATGDIVVGEPQRLRVCSKHNCRDILPLDETRHNGGFAINTIDDSILLQQADELIEINGGSIVRYDLSGFVRSGSRVMMKDAEGNLWLATQADGLVKLTPRSIGLMSDLLGEELENIYAIVEGPDRSIWIGGRRLFRVKNGAVTEYSKTASGPFPVVKALAFDTNQTLWVGGTVGLYEFRENVLHPVNGFENEQLHALTFDSHNYLWIGGSNGLWKYFNGASVHYTKSDLLPSNSVHRIFESKDGAIWVGTMGGVSQIVGDHAVKYTSVQGLSANYVRDIVEDVDGAMWFGTYGGGLDRLRNGRFSAVTGQDGLPNNYISRVIVADDGRFWILSNLGVFVAGLQELNRVADGTSTLLSGATYGLNDGLPSSEANGGHQNAGALGSDGRLWFPMLRDIAIIDPAKLVDANPIVFIESASTITQAGRMELLRESETQGITIDSGVRNLEIEFTGLGFAKPDAMAFRYKLEGLDSEWTYAGQRRKAFYPYLPAGTYTFNVVAVSHSGTLSKLPATLVVNVAEKFWETSLFWLLVAAIIACIVLVILGFRIRQLELRRSQQLEFSRQLINANEAERTRIAKDLHDGLGQHLLLIKNWASMALSGVQDSAATDTDSYLEKISETASVSLDETRSIVQDLGNQSLRRFGLTEAIESMADQVQDATGVIIERSIQNIDGLLSPESELSVYRIVQECFNNVIKHSESPRANIEIIKNTGSISIAVEDYGKGIASDDMPDPQSVGLGFGFRTISGRLGLIGGKVSIDSIPDIGTKVRVEIPI